MYIYTVHLSVLKDNVFCLITSHFHKKPWDLMHKINENEIPQNTVKIMELNTFMS